MQIYRGSSKRNFMKRTDGYKPSHHLFFERGIRETYDYCESRGGKFSVMSNFGQQGMCMKYLCGKVLEPDDVLQAQRFFARYYGMDGVFNTHDWMSIATAKDMPGRLPLEIWAPPEGMQIPVRTPLMVYWNTRPYAWWLPGYIEPLTFKIWNPTTVSTLTQHCKKVIWESLLKTGSPEIIDRMLCNFGYRGVSAEESAEISGAAHLVHHTASDTIIAIDYINEFYSDGVLDAYGDPVYMPANTIRASEHAVMTHEGRKLEAEVARRILMECPTGVVAMVGDSYDIFHFAREILGKDLHPIVIEREGVVLLRPDSGEPIPTMLKVLWTLGECFPTHMHSPEKQYKVLEHVGTIQGDKNNYEAIYEMLRAINGAGWSTDNIGTFGMGGELVQASTRDTQRMKIALSSLTDINGNWRDVNKDPITDPGKYSRPGRFAVFEEDGKIVTRQLKQGEPIPNGNLLRCIYKDGEMVVHDPFETVRARGREWMKA